MDLLSVLEHEVGHLLGREHEATGVMAETLTAGTRLSPGRANDPEASRSAADALFALSADEATPWSGRTIFAPWRPKR
jgi:hypothetical protein